jgi:hypothetical protein
VFFQPNIWNVSGFTILNPTYKSQTYGMCLVSRSSTQPAKHQTDAGWVGVFPTHIWNVSGFTILNPTCKTSNRCRLGWCFSNPTYGMCLVSRSSTQPLQCVGFRKCSTDNFHNVLPFHPPMLLFVQVLSSHICPNLFGVDLVKLGCLKSINQNISLQAHACLTLKTLKGTGQLIVFREI